MHPIYVEHHFTWDLYIKYPLKNSWTFPLRSSIKIIILSLEGKTGSFYFLKMIWFATVPLTGHCKGWGRPWRRRWTHTRPGTVPADHVGTARPEIWNFVLIHYFFATFPVSFFGVADHFGQPDPDPLFHETDPRIRILIHIKTKRIHNTVFFTYNISKLRLSKFLSQEISFF